jgi:hypothetical protein
MELLSVFATTAQLGYWLRFNKWGAPCFIQLPLLWLSSYRSLWGITYGIILVHSPKSSTRKRPPIFCVASRKNTNANYKNNKWKKTEIVYQDRHIIMGTIAKCVKENLVREGSEIVDDSILYFYNLLYCWKILFWERWYLLRIKIVQKYLDVMKM